MKKLTLPIKMLGQSGCRINFDTAAVYIDPYLSESVQLLDSPELQRLTPIEIRPEDVSDADIVLITHDHLDHCDPFTLPSLAKSSPGAIFIGPAVVVERLISWGIDSSRLVIASEDWINLRANLRVKAIPAAHPSIERDQFGNLRCLGFLLEYEGVLIYHSGDTFVDQEIIDVLVKQGDIHTAFLPVNEHNFFRERQGIVGNMTVREAFQFATEIGFKQVIPVHWDMFANNSAYSDELRLIHKNMKPKFDLLISPKFLNLNSIKISIVIRTLNEEKYLKSLLESIRSQEHSGYEIEIVLVDSGSTDSTLNIAKEFGCRIFHITRKEFSFGRSLNIGCESAVGDILVIISAHCIPLTTQWLMMLCRPLLDGEASYAYGRQIAGPDNYFSEKCIFEKYFPTLSKIPQDGFFCNNANSVLLKSIWQSNNFNEELTGLEDMEMARRVLNLGLNIAYIAEAAVIHHHNESDSQIRHRFEREALALQKIMPNVHITSWDSLRYIVASIIQDSIASFQESSRLTFRMFMQIVRYRCNQYFGSWKGNREHRNLSHIDKEKYFYPH